MAYMPTATFSLSPVPPEWKPKPALVPLSVGALHPQMEIKRLLPWSEANNQRKLPVRSDSVTENNLSRTPNSEQSHTFFYFSVLLRKPWPANDTSWQVTTTQCRSFDSKHWKVLFFSARKRGQIQRALTVILRLRRSWCDQDKSDHSKLWLVLCGGGNVT